MRLVFDRVTGMRRRRLLFTDLSFALGAGGACVVTGPNGVGKSSLLRMAAGLLDCAAGTIERDGDVALADENAALDRDLPLEAALDFWARIDRNSASIQASLEALGLARLAPVPVRMLSTGQRKRAALARVMAAGAHIWILDEPANGLDSESVRQLEVAIENHRAAGGIVMIATHQQLKVTDATLIDLAIVSPRQAFADSLSGDPW